MAEFTDLLNTPSDTKRAVGPGGPAVDVFGPIANVAQMFLTADNKAASASNDDLTDMKKIRDLRADVARDRYAVAVTAIQTGDTDNFQHVWGDRGDQYLNEIKRVSDLSKSGELNPLAADVLLNKTFMDVQALFPDAADELGKWASENKIDHVIGRAWKDQQAVYQSSLDAMQTQQADWLKTGMEYWDPNSPIEATPENLMSHGRIVKYKQNMMELDTKELTHANAALEASGKKTDAEMAALKVEREVAGQNTVSRLAGSGQEVFSRIFSDMGRLTQTVTQHGFDTDMTKAFTDALPAWETQITDAETSMLQAAHTLNLTKEEIAPLLAMADRARAQLNRWSSGDASIAKLEIAHVNNLMSHYKMEGGSALASYNMLKEGLGTDVVNGLFNGTLPGFGKADIRAIKDEMIGFVNDKNNNIRDAHEKFLNYQRALNSPDIPNESPEQRAQNITAKAVGLVASSNALSSGKGTVNSTKMFFNTSKGISQVSLDASGPTLKPDDSAKIIKNIFTPQWRNAYKAAGNLAGVDKQAWTEAGQYSGIVAADLLDSEKVMNEEKVKWNSTSMWYEGVVVKDDTYTPGAAFLANEVTAMADGASQAGASNTRNNKAAANRMNMLLDHLQSLDETLGIVPAEALQSAEGEQISAREIFATEANLGKAIDNWVSASKDPELLTAKSQFYKTIKNIKEGTQYPQLDFSNMTLANMMATSYRTRSLINSTPNTYVQITNMDGYRVMMGKTEGGANISGNQAHNLNRSSASGTYGFLNDYKQELSPKGKSPSSPPTTWDANLIEIMPEAAEMTRKQRWELMADPVIEDQVFDHFTAKNYEALKKAAGAPPSFEELNMAHLLGAGGAIKFMKALREDSSTKTKDFFSDNIIKSNPELTKSGDNTLLQMWNARLHRNDPTFSAYMEEMGMPDAQMPITDYLKNDGIVLETPKP